MCCCYSLLYYIFFQEYLEQLEREDLEEHERARLAAQAKTEEALRLEEQARNKMNQDVEESKIVEDMFGFLPDDRKGYVSFIFPSVLE